MVERKKRVSINWSQLRELYIHSSKELHQFSFESTKKEGSPSLSTLQKTAYKERWREARDEIIHEQYMESQGKSQVLQDETHLTLVEARKKLLSSDLTFLRHISIAESIEKIYIEIQPEIHIAVKLIDWKTLAESDPKGFLSAWEKFTNLAKVAIDIERQAMSLSDIKIELISSSQSNIDITTRTENLKEISTVDLIAKYKNICEQ